MADGTSLKMALAINGITNLSKSEIRACYRNKTLQALYQEARQKFLAENYGRTHAEGEDWPLYLTRMMVL